MKTLLPKELTTVEEVALFVKALGENKEIFNPDDSPFDIIEYDTDKRSFTNKEAKQLEKLLKQARKICDVHEVVIRWLHSNGDPFFQNYYEVDEPKFDDFYNLNKTTN